MAGDMMSTIPPIAMLPLPAEDDSVEILDIKLSTYLYVVCISNSIATATGPDHSDSHSDQPEIRAIEVMRPHERQYYRAWKARSPLALPCIDLDKDRGRIPTSQRPLKKANRCAEARNRIYSTTKAEPCHCTHFVKHHQMWLPLVTAVARAIGAERNQKARCNRFQARSRDFSMLRKIIQVSLRIISQVEKNLAETLALRKVRLLQSSLRSRERGRNSSLRKRKHGEGELIFSAEDAQTAIHSCASIPDGEGRGIIETSLAQRPKRA